MDGRSTPLRPAGLKSAGRAWPWPDVLPDEGEHWVEYIGRTTLVVTGPYTGARYRFCQPGARLTVDARDRAAMLSIPMLRAVSG